MNIIGQYESSSSDSEQEEEEEEEEEKNSLPSLPTVILDKFHKAPSLPSTFHNMRLTRVIKPIPGYFNSYCSIEFLPNYSQGTILNNVFRDLQMYAKMSSRFSKIPQFTELHSRGSINNQLHVSLTNNIFLTRQGKSAFQTELKAKLAEYVFNGNNNALTFKGIKLYWNFDKTRLFATLTLSDRSKAEVGQIQKTIVESLEAMGEDVYSTCDFEADAETLHVSFAETIDTVTGVSDEGLLKLNEDLVDIQVDEELVFTYDSVKVNDGTSRLSVKIGDYQV